jgi:hypothetical protein
VMVIVMVMVMVRDNRCSKGSLGRAWSMSSTYLHTAHPYSLASGWKVSELGNLSKLMQSPVSLASFLTVTASLGNTGPGDICSDNSDKLWCHFKLLQLCLICRIFTTIFCRYMHKNYFW